MKVLVSQSSLKLFNPMDRHDIEAASPLCPWDSPGKNIGVRVVEGVVRKRNSTEKKKKYWSGWPFPSPGDLPDPGIKP